MKALTFVAITLVSGAIAGTVLGIINQGIVEPYIERAIEIEMQNAARSGEIINPIEFAAYRLWQKGGEIAAGTILGLSMGALFGIVFAYARGSLPGSNEKKKALILAGILWLVLYLMPAIKYPANPPAVGDPETIYYRQSLYVAFLAISGLGALGLAVLYRMMKPGPVKKVAIPLGYAAIMAAAFVMLPPNPDDIGVPMDLVLGFRLASGFTMTVFWVLIGITAGIFWDKLRPHETTKIRLL
ncbi:MAG: CbtA family protein [Nitrososphaera sp.]|nr:CbtA family protein [Nitrososphaera sp.]